MIPIGLRESSVIGRGCRGGSRIRSAWLIPPGVSCYSSSIPLWVSVEAPSIPGAPAGLIKGCVHGSDPRNRSRLTALVGPNCGGGPAGRDPGRLARERRRPRRGPSRPVRPSWRMGRHPFSEGAHRMGPGRPRLRHLRRPCRERTRRCRVAGIEQPVGRGPGHHREGLLRSRGHRPPGRHRRPSRSDRVGPQGPGCGGEGDQRAPQRSPGIHRRPASSRRLGVARRPDRDHHRRIGRELEQDGASGRLGAAEAGGTVLIRRHRDPDGRQRPVGRTSTPPTARPCCARRCCRGR